MYDGGFVGAFFLRPLGVHVNPLVVQRGIGKGIDALLGDFKVVGHTDDLSAQFGEIFVRVDDDFSHIETNVYQLYYYMWIVCAKIRNSPEKALTSVFLVV